MTVTKAKLTKIESTHSNLRTNEVVGLYFIPPTEGQRFSFISEALDTKNSDYKRVIDTSEVKEVLQINNGVIFKTQNSTYRLEEVEELLTQS